MGAERRRLLLAYALPEEDVLHLPGGDGGRVRVFVLPVGLDLLPELFVDGLYHLQTAAVRQGGGQGGLKRLLLLIRGHGRLGAEHPVQEILVDIPGGLGVKQDVVDIGRAVVKGREQEAQFRLGHDLSGDAAVELVLSGEVAQLQLAVLHGTDAAEDVSVYGVGISRLVVPGPSGHVVGVIGQQDHVVGVPHIQGVDDLPVELLPDLSALQLRLPQGGEQTVLVTVHHLLGGKNHIYQVSAQGAGHGLFQKAQVFIRLLLAHPAQGFVQIGDDLLVSVDVAAVDALDGALVRAEAAAQLAQFFLVHSSFLISRRFA